VPSTASTLTTPALWDLPRVGAPSADDAGEVVVVPVTTVTTTSSTTQLWRVGPDREPVQLTHGEAGASAPRVSPDGRHVAFVRKVGDHAQVHVLDLRGGEGRQVTDLPLGVVGSSRWAGPDHLLVVTRLVAEDPTTDATVAWRDAGEERPKVLATERRLTRAWDTWYVDPLTEHVLRIDVTDDDAEPQDLTPGTWLLPDPLDDPAANTDVSADGRWLAFTTSDPEGDEEGVPITRVHVVDLQGPGEVRCLTPDTPGPAGAPRFLPDGRIAVAIRSERDFYAAQQQLWAIDPADGSRDPLLVDHDELFSGPVVGPDGRIVLATEVEGRGRLLEVLPGTDPGDGGGSADGADGAVRELPAPEVGGLSSPCVTRVGVFAAHSALLAPHEVVLVGDERVEEVTAFARPSLADVDLGRVEERTVTGGDGDPVQVFVLHPPSSAVEGDGPPPLVHMIHGGPHGTFGDTWHWRWCAARFAAEGWVVALVNFHGSTSFGHEFTRSIHGDWATLPTQDVLAATDALVEDGTVDGDRMAITGGSYGGYLTTWLTTQTDRFTVAVAHAAVTDFGGMWATDWTSGFAEAFGGELWDDPEGTYRFSPSWHYGGMSTPMLVLHGDRDLRVPIDQGRALYGVLQAMRIPSRLVVFPTENHWVLDRRHSERWYDEVLGWLHRWLED
jgi:dipeptidyl aminopeptidase/acylaminoacyl peptidase